MEKERGWAQEVEKEKGQAQEVEKERGQAQEVEKGRDGHRKWRREGNACSDQDRPWKYKT